MILPKTNVFTLGIYYEPEKLSVIPKHKYKRLYGCKSARVTKTIVASWHGRMA